MRALGCLVVPILSLMLVGSASAQDAGGPDCGDFSVYGVVDTRAFVDLGDTGPTGGDQRVGRYMLSDADGKDIGLMHFSSIVMPPLKGAESPVMTTLYFNLPNGSLVASGVIGLPNAADIGTGPDQDLQYAVLGGTGTFAHASGTLTTKTLDDGRREMTFALSCPN